LWPSDETTEGPSLAPVNDSTLPGGSKKATAMRESVKSTDNASLVRRAEADFVRIRRHEIAPPSLPEKPRPPIGFANTSADRREQLSESETKLLFRALSRGTEKHMDRSPQVSELVQLVGAINDGLCPDLLIPAALAGNLDVYWDGNAWAFEQATPNPIQAVSNPAQDESVEEDDTNF
jgi:hypothetical protein